MKVTLCVVFFLIVLPGQTTGKKKNGFKDAATKYRHATKTRHSDRQDLQEHPVRLFCDKKVSGHVRHSTTRCIRRATRKYKKCFSADSPRPNRSKTCKAFKRQLKLKTNHRKQLRMNTAVCGGNNSPSLEYNSRTHLCCNGVILPKAGDNLAPDDRQYMVCCGPLLLNKSSHICCDGTIKTKGAENEKCCGTDLMDETSQFCYMGQILERTTEENHTETSIIRTNFGVSFNGADLEDDVQEPTGSNESGSSGTPTWMVLAISAAIFGISFVGIIGIVRYKNIKQRKFEEPSVTLSCTHSTAMVSLNSKGRSRIPQFDSILLHEEENETINMNTKTIGDRKESVVSLTSSVIKLRLPSDYDSESETSSFIAYLHTSECSDLIAKPTETPSNNLTMNIFLDAAAQTEVGKELNKRDCFGAPFQFQGLIDMKTPTLQLPHSTVTLTLSEQDLRNAPIECGASSFYNIGAIRNKLGLDETQQLVSPAVEYCFTALKRLSQYAVIKMPFVCNAVDVEVWKVKSDEGLGVPIMDRVTENKEFNEDMELDTFFVHGQNKTVYIYTKTFSWFTCLCKTEKRYLRLRSIIYGSIKNSVQLQRRVNVVDLTIYIVEELQTLGDFAWPFRQKEEGMLRKEIENKQIDMLEDLKWNDYLDVFVTLLDDSRDNWQHRRYADGTVIYPERKKIEFDKVVQCHSRSYDPYKVDWCFVTGETATSCFQCIVSVECQLANPGDTDGPPSCDNRYIVDEVFEHNVPHLMHPLQTPELNEAEEIHNAHSKPLHTEDNPPTDVIQREVFPNLVPPNHLRTAETRTADGLVRRELHKTPECSYINQEKGLEEAADLPSLESLHVEDLYNDT